MKIKAVLIQFIIIIIHLGDYIERPHTIFHSFKLHFLFLHFITYIHNVHNVHNVHSVHLYINLACLSVCLFVCLFIKFLKILKIHEIFCENPRIIFVLFYDVRKENMFTINLEDGR